jgi:hypothetical protein
VTRRCSQRQFLLRPSRRTNQIYEYSLAVAAERSGVLVHAATVMSNHSHLTTTDVRGTLPEFLRDHHSLVARCINASLARWENLWDDAQTSLVSLEDDESVLRRLAYILCNPTAAGLVAFGHEWPGVRTSPREIAGFEKVVRRPDILCREDGPLPETAVLRITPPSIAGMSPAAIAKDVEDRVRLREQELRAVAKAAGRSFMGRAAVLAMSPFDRPKTPEPRRRLSPRVAAAEPQVRVAAIKRIAQFVQQYRQALARWLQGVRDVLFPFGTYLLRLRSAVHCAESGAT